MAGFTSEQINTILATILKVLEQGGNRVRFPDGSEVQYANRKELVDEYAYWVGLQNAADATATPSSFVVRTSKGTS